MTFTVVKNSNGEEFLISNTMKNSAGTEFDVANDVKDSDGNPFTIFTDEVDVGPVKVIKFKLSEDRIHML